MLSKIKKILKVFANKEYRMSKLIKLGIYNRVPDEKYLKKVYKTKFGYDLDLDNPKTYNEKLQWLKLYNRKPIYTTMVDKYEVKKYVADIIGEEHIIPTLGIWDRFEDIDFDALPEQFVLKCTHDSGGLVICRDKSKLNLAAAKRKIKKSLRRNFFYKYREWPYKNVPRKIIAEKYMQDESGALTDYKFMCFNGKVDCVMICLDRHIGEPKFYFFDKNWELKRYNKRGVEAPEDFTIRKPECMDRMFELAEKLCVGLPHIRVDLYEVDGKIYFGELTFFQDSGYGANCLPETQLHWGSLINLNMVEYKCENHPASKEE